MKFDHLDINSGLSENNVISILQDSRGFMWIGTQDGLNKYDGYTFTTYKKDIQTKFSLNNNYIKDIIEDGHGNLWIATWGGGLNRYDREKDQFTHFKHSPLNEKSISGDFLASLVEDHEGNLWISTELGGLNKFEPAKGEFIHYAFNINDSSSLSDMEVTSIIEDSKDNLWIGTEKGGLNLFDKKKNLFHRYQHNDMDDQSLSNNTVRSIFEDSKHNLWIGTNGGGLNLFNRETGKFRVFKKDAHKKNSLCNDVVFSITEDDQGILWVGTENGGISMFDPKTLSFTNYEYSDLNNNSLSSNSINTIYKDKRGNMWIGTYNAGINFVNQNADKFTLYKHTPATTTLSNNNVMSICEDSKNNLWIGTDGGGLNMLDKKTGNFKHFFHNKGDNNSICGNYILSVIEDSYENLWVGTWGDGVTVFNKKKNSYTHFKNDPNDPASLAGNNAWVIFEDRKKNIWIGTQNSGICLYDRAGNHFINYNHQNNNLSNNNVISITEDTEGLLWIGTDGGGLNQFDKKENKFISFKHDDKKNSLSDNTANCLYDDQKGHLWIGTNAGLNCMDKKTKSFTAWQISDGLPNDVISGILEDKHGNLWISTNKGLSCFNPDKKTFKNFTLSDGLQSDEFKQSYFKSHSGLMYFGGINGFNEFFPDSIKEIPFEPPLVMTGLRIFNKEVPVARDEHDASPLKKNISETNAITLPYESSVISFEFASLIYTNIGKKKYAYFMEGFDKNWTGIGFNRTATYTNLDPGKYIFRVKGLNNDGSWSTKTLDLQIIITPPFWMTWWFRTLAGIFGVGMAILFFRIRINIIEAQKKVLESQVQERTESLARITEEERKARLEAEQANKTKSVFLATMSHEIRTPMNGVIGMASLLIRTPLNDEQRNYTETIQTCGENLLTVINDILDFSKIESGKMELEEKDFDLRNCIEEVLDVFAAKAAHAGLDLVYQIGDDVPSQISGDVTRLKQILINLVGNAVKFTEHGEVFVRVKLLKCEKNGKMELGFEVKDTGIGIPPDKLQRLFKAFSQVDSSTTRKYGGTGLGLIISEKLIGLMGGNISVQSEPQKGSVFLFSIVTMAGVLPLYASQHHNMPELGRKRILVVDDNLTNRSILKIQLEQWKLEPVLASSGMQALDILSHQHGFDLVLTDMHMPEMDGIELAASIRGKYPRLPIMLLSSVGDELCKNYPELFCSVLTKPIRQNILYKHILQNFGKREDTPSQKGNIYEGLSENFSAKYPMRILVAEDNKINQQLALIILNKLGYHPDIAENGREVLDKMHAVSYDTILMDVQMPEMDGLEASRIIRQKMGSQPVIIALTANAMQQDQEICLQSGMDDYLSKPIKVELLMRMLEKWALQVKESI
ncbi:MAG TPA: two-component regulator propeller domain-containing protein [Puia sp.]|nr:two-component regulator propeller domain-containing protein [Puia sp.]